MLPITVRSTVHNNDKTPEFLCQDSELAREKAKNKICSWDLREWNSWSVKDGLLLKRKQTIPIRDAQSLVTTFNFQDVSQQSG